jgi:hypothetical protein
LRLETEAEAETMTRTSRFICLMTVRVICGDLPVGHLVKSLSLDAGKRITLSECLDLLAEAHDYLARQGVSVVQEVLGKQNLRSWGGDLKRIRVPLPLAGRPRAISCDDEDHNYIEVINQCATMERLLDALAWVMTPDSGFSDYSVEYCHPTTSSQTIDGEKVSHDNDLVLISDGGTRARFEVSDVASTKDGNGKEKKDLISLGALKEGKGREQFDVIWPSSRLFLVVSKEFASRIEKPTRSWLKGPQAHCQYIKLTTQNPSTVIFEVKQGPKGKGGQRLNSE